MYYGNMEKPKHFTLRILPKYYNYYCLVVLGVVMNRNRGGCDGDGENNNGI